MPSRLVAILALIAAPASAGDIAATIDRHIGGRLREGGATPAPEAPDHEFLRRASLDLIGRIPTVAEARGFLGDASPDRRDRLVDRLLAGPEAARHFATTWRRAWLPQSETPLFTELADGYESWLREEFLRGTPYDRLVAMQLTASYRPTGPEGDRSPRSFLMAGQFKPENLAANTTRSFLGLNLDCAQCHDHPFAHWTRDQFWQTAAFFAPSGRSIAIEGTDRTVAAALFTGEELSWPDSPDALASREALAKWITAKENPYFARNAVNRVWAQMFGTGLVEPLDDLSEENESEHGELLNELARGFAEGGFDLKSLARGIALSRAYRRTSMAAADDSGPDPSLFARMPVRALTGEQLYDSLLTAAGLPLPPASSGIRSDRARFAARYRAAREAFAERSVSQALTLANGPLMAELTRTEASPILRALAASPALDDGGRVEILFLATLGRPPGPDEREAFATYLGEGDRERGLGNLFWALLNGNEFNTNH